MSDNYIACDDDTKSEIVVPCFSKKSNGIRTVLDIDSELVGTFDLIDKEWLEKILKVMYNKQEGIYWIDN